MYNDKCFNIQIDKINCMVEFRDYNDRAVVCEITASTPRGTVYEAVGRAKCNYDAGDKFDIFEGQKISLEKALCKLEKQMGREVRSMERFLFREKKRIERVKAGLMQKQLRTAEKIREKMANPE